MLTLHAALAASVLQRPGLITAWLDEAAQLAGRVPDDLRSSWEHFSATNVGIWRVAIGIERGEVGGTLHVAKAVREDKLVIRSRKADFFTEIGRGLAHEPRSRDKAVRWLRKVEDTAPQRVRNKAEVRETVAYLLRISPVVIFRGGERHAQGVDFVLLGGRGSTSWARALKVTLPLCWWAAVHRCPTSS